MKHLLRIIFTIPALILFGIRGVAAIWKFGGSFTVNPFPPQEAIRLLRDLHDLQNGAPLEQDRAEWEDTMKQVQEFLNKYEQQ